MRQTVNLRPTVFGTRDGRPLYALHHATPRLAAAAKGRAASLCSGRMPPQTWDRVIRALRPGHTKFFAPSSFTFTRCYSVIILILFAYRTVTSRQTPGGDHKRNAVTPGRTNVFVLGRGSLALVTSRRRQTTGTCGRGRTAAARRARRAAAHPPAPKPTPCNRWLHLGAGCTLASTVNCARTGSVCCLFRPLLGTRARRADCR